MSDSFAYLSPCNNSWYARAYPRVKNEQECFAEFETRGAALSDVSLSSDCHRALHSAQGGLSRVACLDWVPVFWVSHNRDFKIQRRGRQRESRKNNRLYEQTTTLNKQTKFYLFLNMVMVPRNSTPGGFAYIRQSKWVMTAIKTERTQIHFKRRSRCRRVVGS